MNLGYKECVFTTVAKRMKKDKRYTMIAFDRMGAPYTVEFTHVGAESDGRTMYMTIRRRGIHGHNAIIKYMKSSFIIYEGWISFGEMLKKMKYRQQGEYITAILKQSDHVPLIQFERGMLG